MLPAGVAINMPSQMSSGMRTTPSTRMAILAAWRVSRRSETSLKARAWTVSPPMVRAVMASGWSSTRWAAASRAGRPSSRYWFIRKPMVPQFMPKIGTPRSMNRCSVSSITPSPPSATITSAWSEATWA